MANETEKPAPPEKRWVILTFWEHAVERTLPQIEELKAGRLWLRDASGPEDRQSPAAAPVVQPAQKAPAAATPAPAA